ncbi:MAG: radical SAM protein [Magnetococcus sp. DMHC-6]
MNDRYAIDSHKLIYHPIRTAQYLEGKEEWEKSKTIYPIYVEISPIGACNHRCVFCALDYMGYQPKKLEVELLQQRLPEMARLGIKSVMFAGEGEPLLHKGICDIVLIAKTSGLDVAITSNATILPAGFLDKALPALSWIKISINAGTSKGYATIHGTREEDFFIAIANMKEMVRVKRQQNLDCVLGAQALLLPENADEMETLCKICRDDIGLNYVVIKPYSQHLFSHTKRFQSIDYTPLLALKDQLTSLNTPKFSVVFRDQTMRKYMENDRYTHCYATPFLWGYISADGTVSGCSAYLLDKNFEYGNIHEKSFQEIWEGEGRRLGWHFIREQLDIKECRRNCRMDEINRYLHKIQTQSVPHVNFI